MKHEITIIPFQKEHQNDIDGMMQDIALEFEEPIFSVQSKKIADVFELSANKFWVAITNNKVIGTVGLVKLSNQNLVLKSMFVDQSFRGQNVSSLLLNTLVDWAIEYNYTQIYLGTMSQFIGGQRFYEKNGFVKCHPTDLPTDFIVNTLDTIFYTKYINQNV